MFDWLPAGGPPNTQALDRFYDLETSDRRRGFLSISSYDHNSTLLSTQIEAISLSKLGDIFDLFSCILWICWGIQYSCHLHVQSHLRAPEYWGQDPWISVTRFKRKEDITDPWWISLFLLGDDKIGIPYFDLGMQVLMPILDQPPPLWRRISSIIRVLASEGPGAAGDRALETVTYALSSVAVLKYGYRHWCSPFYTLDRYHRTISHSWAYQYRWSTSSSPGVTRDFLAAWLKWQAQSPVQCQLAEWQERIHTLSWAHWGHTQVHVFKLLYWLALSLAQRPENDERRYQHTKRDRMNINLRALQCFP